ncbi:MAG: hydroxymethylglutaryl-CoA lyase [Chitinophagaceae bacterium]|nr:hydroxymethylglutaryl-CoA lyase [Chitinophagaceae bacterium]
MKLIECPRDAMQGWTHFIPTAAKVAYIHSLLEVGFDTLDFGSFVSPKAIPQMADTPEVLKQLRMDGTATRLLAIVANLRGAQDAVAYEQISYLGFPFSVSETFQQRNTNSSIKDSFQRVSYIQELCVQNNKQLVVYISMGFGNPYGDPYSFDILFNWINQIRELGVETISLADTVGVATPEQVHEITTYLKGVLPGLETGVHLHSTSANWKQKLEAAYKAGITRFDGALKGIGGCPMAGSELVGNMNTEWMLSYFKEQGQPFAINEAALARSLALADKIFI